MKIFRQTRGLVDKMMGAKKRSSLHRDSKMIDSMQSFTTIGEYHVDQKEDTPGGKPYVLTVYKDEKGVLHQALSPESTQKLAPEYVRMFDEDLGHFRAFKNTETGRRYQVERYLDQFTVDV